MFLANYTVREICQTASSGSYVVGYTAEIELTDDPTIIEIDVLSTKPADADKNFINYAAEHTREGFAEVLEPLGRGAKVRIYDLVLHAVDYNSIRQRAFSAQHLAAALGC